MDISALRERNNTEAFTVTGLNNYIKGLFEGDRVLTSVTVKGEISNFVNHRSGHLYFSLKDAEGQIRAVMFRSYAARLKFMPESGMKVVIHGAVSVYARDGSYQIYVSSMQPDGIGALYLAYEQIKARLLEEGLFDDAHKLPIPALPRKIGVITSPTGAAVRDILNVTGRRYPLADIYLYPALVQGEGAEADLIRAVDYFDRSRLVDVVIIGRGGGSIEDLWAFNSEALARRIYEAKVPIISAVGHETDFTICDFVSDLRAPTPSAAAELAVPDIRELYMRIDAFSERASVALERGAERSRAKLERLCEMLFANGIDSVAEGARMRISDAYSAITRYMDAYIGKTRERLVLSAEKMNVMNPLSVLRRGYAIAESCGSVIYSVDSLKEADLIDIRLADGKVSASVKSIIREKTEDE